MVVFDKNFEAIKIDTEFDEAELLELYKEKSGDNVYPAQAVKILLSIIAYSKSLVLSRINECVKNLLLPYAKGVWLDILGYLVGCIRQSATRAYDTVTVKLYEPFSFVKIIPKGAKLETSDGLYQFEIDEDIVFAPNETEKTGKIYSSQAGSVLNNYSKGEINSFIENYEFVESVANIYGCKGGSDEESDDDYRERIASAPEHYSVAGPEGAYKYFIESSHPDIIDSAVELADDDVYIVSNGVTYKELNNQINFNSSIIAVNYNECSVTIPAGTYSNSIKICFPKQSVLDVYILTKEGQADAGMLDTVKNEVEKVRPLSDYINYKSAIPNEFTIDAIITIKKDYNSEDVIKEVNNALNEFLNELKLHLKRVVLASDIVHLIKNINGVYDVDLCGFKSINADAKSYNVGKLGSIQYKSEV